MFPLWKGRESQKMQTSNDDDAGGYEKPDLDYIIGASLVDDLGVNSAIFERIFEFYRSRHYCRTNYSSLGRSKNIRTIKMARQETKSKI